MLEQDMLMRALEDSIKGHVQRCTNEIIKQAQTELENSIKKIAANAALEVCRRVRFDVMRDEIIISIEDKRHG